MPQYAQHILRIREFTTSHWGRAGTALTICALVVWSGTTKRLSFVGPAAETRVATENRIDDGLQRAAADALGQRDGTIIVMDPQTGRVRAVVNPAVAFANSFAPGSTIKPFVALAALRAGVIDQSSRTLCREHYSHDDFATVCAHPRDLPPMNPAEAIEYSCNYFFGTLGERLNEERLSETLRSFGFGRPTGVGNDHEATGSLLRGKRDPRNTLGEGSYLQATPIQLLTAYSALVNGGQLLTPGVARADDFHISRRAQLEIAAEHRSLIIEGMRGAVRFGTAKNAALQMPDLYIFGKTGTSTPTAGFRSQGWFVGFAADQSLDGTPATDKVELAVLVFLKRAHGAEAAALSRAVFEGYGRQRDGETGGWGDGGMASDTETGGRGDTGTSFAEESVPPSPRLPITPSLLSSVPASPRLHVPVSSVSVHLVRENITKQVSLEEYVAGVVATEGSMEDQPEALKALAVAARTYALKNLGRHAREGYDFCTLTHCQRFLSTDQAIDSSSQALTNRRALAAVRATAGIILHDERGQPADSYFSASCGGATANIQTLWGVSPPSYLRGVPDEYCATMPHHSWTDVISVAQLWQALRSDPRTDPGVRLDNVTVARRDATGRAESIAVAGQQQRIVSGWDFKIIVGRALGWNKLKSSRFEISHSGSAFVFRGSGFGHGLGLCQEGAHVLAQRGASYQQILAKYFPGATVGNGNLNAATLSPPSNGSPLAAALPLPSAVRLCLTAAPFSFPSRRLCLLEHEAQPRNQSRNGPEWHSLSALGSGEAAKDGKREQAFADLLWDDRTQRRLHSAIGSEEGYNSRRNGLLSGPTSLLPVVPSTHPPVSLSPLLHVAPSLRRSISSEHFRVSYPAQASQREAEGVLRTLESTRGDLLHRAASAGLSITEPPTLDIFVNESTGDFVGRTGQPSWAAAVTKGSRIELQPIQILQRRGVLITTLRHELSHVVIDSISRGRAPRWLAEGMALYFAGEGPLIAGYTQRAKMTTEEIEKRLTQAKSAVEMRASYAAAYRAVSDLIRRDGEASIWQRAAGR